MNKQLVHLVYVVCTHLRNFALISCASILVVGINIPIYASSFDERIESENSNIFGSDITAPETINLSSMVTNPDASGGNFTVSATTSGGHIPLASVGGTLTNQHPNASGELRLVLARVVYDIAIIPLLQALPANLLVPLVINASGSASVTISDPSQAGFGVASALLLTLPDPQGNPSSTLTIVDGAQASVTCSGFNFCTVSSYLEGFADSYQYSATFQYAPSTVTVELWASIGRDPYVLSGETITFQAKADPDIHIDSTATFESTMGETVRFVDAFELRFSPGILPGLPVKNGNDDDFPWEIFMPAIQRGARQR